MADKAPLSAPNQSDSVFLTGSGQTDTYMRSSTFSSVIRVCVILNGDTVDHSFTITRGIWELVSLATRESDAIHIAETTEEGCGLCHLDTFVRCLAGKSSEPSPSA